MKKMVITGVNGFIGRHAKEYFEKVEGTKIIPPKVNVKVDKLLRDFIINGGYEIQMPTEDE